jgi:hypothetical protein
MQAADEAVGMARRLITALSLAALALPAPAAMASDIFTVAGTGVPGFAGDGGRATAADLHYPGDVEPTVDGGYLIADYSNRVVRRVSATGKIRTVAGTPGVGGYAGDGGQATAALLSGPTAVIETRDGGFLIADSTNHCVRKVSATGIITTVAGTGVAGSRGDGGPATSARLRKPGGVAVASDKSLLIADSGNDRIRRVASDGTITTVAGTGTRGYSGDGGPATRAQLYVPLGLVATPDGGFLFADKANHAVRWVSSGGTIATVAGRGAVGFSGDGGRATSAQLAGPSDVALLPTGGFLIADTSNHVIRRVGSWKGGKIDTVAGTGIAGFSGDGVAARRARMNHPAAVATRADGSVLIADIENHRIRLVEPLDEGSDWLDDFGRGGR